MAIGHNTAVNIQKDSIEDVDDLEMVDKYF